MCQKNHLSTAQKINKQCEESELALSPLSKPASDVKGEPKNSDDEDEEVLEGYNPEDFKESTWRPKCLGTDDHPLQVVQKDRHQLRSIWISIEPSLSPDEYTNFQAYCQASLSKGSEFDSWLSAQNFPELVGAPRPQIKLSIRAKRILGFLATERIRKVTTESLKGQKIPAPLDVLKVESACKLLACNM